MGDGVGLVFPGVRVSSRHLNSSMLANSNDCRLDSKEAALPFHAGTHKTTAFRQDFVLRRSLCVDGFYVSLRFLSES
jgi:hypothetical protein